MPGSRPAQAGVLVRVPATSANLGPGFDALALALGLHDEVEVRVTDGGIAVEVVGEGAADVRRDEGHLVVRAACAAFDALGVRRPGLALRCRNRIPHGRGLGSSAAAIVAGLSAARALSGEAAAGWGDDAVLALASQLEGHADNVAACLHGGLTLTWCEGGRPRVVGLPLAPGLRVVALVPAAALATVTARTLLPATVPHADAAHAAGRTGLLVEALARRPELLLAATEDRLHQPYRAAGMPASAALVAALREAGVPAVVSGAGPTVLALLAEESPALPTVPDGFVARPLPVQHAGVRVEHLR